jgi:hypothetical protein
MTRQGVAAFTLVALFGLTVQAEAQTPCQNYLGLRNAASEAWKQAMRAPRSDRCEAFNRASLAAAVTLTYAEANRESCAISGELLNQVEVYRREALQARDNACAGRPLRSYPAEILHRWDPRK